MLTGTRKPTVLSAGQPDRFDAGGHLVVEGFYLPDEVKLLIRTFMEMHR